MKKIILALTLGIAVFFANAQDNKTTTTPATTNKSTVTTTNKSTATTTNKATATTTNPQSQVTKSVVKPEELQKAITENIKQDYPDYKVTKAIKIDSVAKGKTIYEIRVEKSTTGKEVVKENLFYDKEGNFLRKVTPPTKPVQMNKPIQPKSNMKTDTTKNKPK